VTDTTNYLFFSRHQIKSYFPPGENNKSRITFADNLSWKFVQEVVLLLQII